MPALWPPCSKQDCEGPGIFRFDLVNDHGPLTAYLCPVCILQAPALLKEIAAIRDEQRLLLEEETEQHAPEEPRA